MFQLFRAGYLSSDRERRQMTRLIGYLASEYGSRGEDEKCLFIIEPSIPEIIRGREIPRYPDALILKDGMFVIVEMKEYKGEIIADCSTDSAWRSSSGEIIQPPGSQNPFEQASFYRDVLVEFLQTRFVDYKSAPGWAKVTPAKMEEWVEQHVVSLIVTDEASRPSVTGFFYRQPRFFDVVPLDKLPQKIAFLRASTQLFKPSKINSFIKALGAKPTTLDWYRGALNELSSFVGLIPKITDWMESEEHEHISRGLRFIKELDLKQHIPHVANCWREKKYPDLRIECLYLLIEWQSSEIGKALDEALNDEDSQIFHFALDYLSKHGYIETIPSLERILKVGSPEIQKVALKAIAASGDKSSAATIFDFAKKNLFDQPFKEFQFWSERVKKYREKLVNRVVDKEFAELERKKASTVSLFCTVIDALGYLDYTESIPWLMQIVDDPTSIGFEATDYSHLNSFFSSYFRVFEAACKALGSLGKGNKKITELLVGKLANAPEEYQQRIINTLGDLDDLNAESALLPFVIDRNHIFFYDATLALSKLKSEKAFDPIAKAYLHNVHDDSGHWAEEALAKINPIEFEKILLEKIKSEENDDETKIYFLSILLPIVTLESADVLFPLLANEELSGNAAWVLWKLSYDKGVRERAMRLTQSNNPLEKATAIYVLEDYFKQNLDELEKLKKGASVEVRGAIMSIYYASKLKDKLVEFANDSDEQIRDGVFLYFAGDAIYHGSCVMASNFTEPVRCQVVINRETLILKLPEEVLFLPKQFLKAQITDNDDVFGVYIENTQNNQLIQRMLLVPLDRSIGVSERMAQKLFSDLGCSANSLTVKDRSNIRNLWEKIPKNMIPENKRYPQHWAFLDET